MIDICFINPRTETLASVEKWQDSAEYKGGVLTRVEKDVREPPNGLLILATIMQNKGYDVEILDCSILQNPKEAIIKKASMTRLMAFTSLTNTIFSALELIKLAKKSNPDLIIALGGPHASFKYDTLLKDHSSIDVIFLGEAEESFPEVCDILLKGPAMDLYDKYGSEMLDKTLNFSNYVIDKLNSQITPILGIAYDDKFTGWPKAINLDNIPKLSRESFFQGYSVANILINRGCSNKCSFCSRSNLFPKTRIRPLDAIIDEINSIISMKDGNYEIINFYDNINLNRKYFNTFLHEIKKIDNMLPWGAELRVDLINKEEAILMKETNCMGIATGIETANEDVLKFNGKYQNMEDIKKGISHLKSAGLTLQLYFILGLPHETKESFQKSFDLIRELPLERNIDQIEFFLPTPYPGAELTMNPKKYGINILSYDYNEYNCRNILLETEDLNKDDIGELQIQARKLKNELGLI